MTRNRYVAGTIAGRYSITMLQPRANSSHTTAQRVSSYGAV